MCYWYIDSLVLLCRHYFSTNSTYATSALIYQLQGYFSSDAWARDFVILLFNSKANFSEFLFYYLNHISISLASLSQSKTQNSVKHFVQLEQFVFEARKNHVCWTFRWYWHSFWGLFHNILNTIDSLPHSFDAWCHKMWILHQCCLVVQH